MSGSYLNKEDSSRSIRLPGRNTRVARGLFSRRIWAGMEFVSGMMPPPEQFYPGACICRLERGETAIRTDRPDKGALVPSRCKTARGASCLRCCRNALRFPPPSFTNRPSRKPRVPVRRGTEVPRGMTRLTYAPLVARTPAYPYCVYRRLVMGSGDDLPAVGQSSNRITDALIHRLYMVTWAVGSEW